jgi:hypothetical protein
VRDGLRLVAMETQPESVHYDREPPTRKPHLSRLAAWLAAAQLFWWYPAAFVTMVVLCDNGWVRAPLAEVLGALFVVFPSVVALPCGALALRRGEPAMGTVPAIVAVVASVGWLAWLGFATVHDLRFPPPYPCP